MKRFLGVAIVSGCVLSLGNSLRADGPDAKAIVDKAIKALGGEEKLSKASSLSWKTKGVLTFGENENPITTESTVQGMDHFRGDFEGEFNGMTVKGVTVVNGNKGWRKFGENAMDMDDNGLTSAKQSIYLQVIPTTMVALKGKDFKAETAGEEKVGDAMALVLKVTCPDGKNFKISFDKESGLPLKLVATVAGFDGNEFSQETTLSEYKDFSGIKKATKSISKRDGMPFLQSVITEFKVVDKVDSEKFSEPK
jgi:hypothetical protein